MTLEHGPLPVDPAAALAGLPVGHAPEHRTEPGPRPVEEVFGGGERGGRELVAPTARVGGEPDALEQRGVMRAALDPGPAAHDRAERAPPGPAARHRDRLGDAQGPGRHRDLADPDQSLAGALAGIRSRDLPAVVNEAAGFERQRPDQTAQPDRLSRPPGAAEREDLALLDGERERVEHRDDAHAAGEPDDFEDSHAGRHCAVNARTRSMRPPWSIVARRWPRTTGRPCTHTSVTAWWDIA